MRIPTSYLFWNSPEEGDYVADSYSKYMRARKQRKKLKDNRELYRQLHVTNRRNMFQFAKEP